MTAFNRGTVSMLTSLPEAWEPLNPAPLSLSIPPNIQSCWFHLPWISLIHPLHSAITSTSTTPPALPWGHAEVSYSPALLHPSSIQSLWLRWIHHFKIQTWTYTAVFPSYPLAGPSGASCGSELLDTTAAWLCPALSSTAWSSLSLPVSPLHAHPCTL